MRERVVEYYRAVRSVRTSTWVLLIIAIGSNVLYYQVRPDPIYDGPGGPGTPVVTEPGPEDTPQGSTTSVPPVDQTVRPSVPATGEDPGGTTSSTTTTVTQSSVVPSTGTTEPGTDQEPTEDDDPDGDPGSNDDPTDPTRDHVPPAND